MPKTTKIKTSEPVRKSRPALTPEARENQMIAKAMNLAERQLEDGSASSQVITHFLKLGTTKAQVELEKLKRENSLLQAKTDSIQSAQRIEQLYEKAIQKMKRYGGHDDDEDED